MGLVQRVTDEGEIVVCEAYVSIVGGKCRSPKYLLRRLPIHGVLPMVLYSDTTRFYGALLTCQVFKINVFDDGAKIYVRRRHRNGLDGNWLRAESHG